MLGHINQCLGKETNVNQFSIFQPFFTFFCLFSTFCRLFQHFLKLVQKKFWHFYSTEQWFLGVLFKGFGSPLLCVLCACYVCFVCCEWLVCFVIIVWVCVVCIVWVLTVSCVFVCVVLCFELCVLCMCVLCILCVCVCCLCVVCEFVWGHLPDSCLSFFAQKHFFRYLEFKNHIFEGKNF